MNINLKFDVPIGVTDVPPLRIELRLGPPGMTGEIDGQTISVPYTWLMRCEETGGQWMDAPVHGSADYAEVKRALAEEWPLHRIDWPEQYNKWAWSDC